MSTENKDQMSAATEGCAAAAGYATIARVRAMSDRDVAAAIAACHPCELETLESYQADAVAMDLIHGRHEKREIVNLLRWVLMGCPSHTVEPIHGEKDA